MFTEDQSISTAARLIACDGILSERGGQAKARKEEPPVQTLGSARGLVG